MNNIENKGMTKRVSEILGNEPPGLSASFRIHNREKMLTIHSHVSKKSFIKKAWHGVPNFNIKAYRMQFYNQGQKVRYDLHDSYPIFVLGVKFKPEKSTFGNQNYSKEVKVRFKKMVKTQYFESLIWCSYRNKLEHNILSDTVS